RRAAEEPEAVPGEAARKHFAGERLAPPGGTELRPVARTGHGLGRRHELSSITCILDQRRSGQRAIVGGPDLHPRKVAGGLAADEVDTVVDGLAAVAGERAEVALRDPAPRQRVRERVAPIVVAGDGADDHFRTLAAVVALEHPLRPL